IDAFRRWGIYPRDVSSLSEDSLRWRQPGPDDAFTSLRQASTFQERFEKVLSDLARALDNWQPHSERADPSRNARAEVFGEIQPAQRRFHALLWTMQSELNEQPGMESRSLLPGLDLRMRSGFSVGNLRPARRVGPQGDFRTEMVVEVVQTLPRTGDDPPGG